LDDMQDMDIEELQDWRERARLRHAPDD